MINQDNEKTHIEGNSNTIINEAASLLHNIAAEIADKSNATYEEVIRQISLGAGIYKLCEAGMTPEEAIEVLDVDNTIRGINREKSVGLDDE